jgi:tol-pal system beta propeller repeat protein TolB
VRRLTLALAAVAICSACVSVAPGGGAATGWRLVYASESPDRRGLDVYVVSVPGGRPRRVAGRAGRDDFAPAWSPNGKLIAYRANPARGDESDIIVVAATGSTPRNLTNSPGVADWSPAWSPDGRTIAFFSMRTGGRDLWLMRADGSGKRRLTNDGSLNEYPTWSPDGRTIAYQSARQGEFEIYAVTSDGRRQRNLSRHPARDQWADWSPDGAWIAFMSTRDGSDDVFVMRPDGSGVRNLTRTPRLQESHPTWRPNGELTFSRHGESGPIELWRIGADGRGARRLSTDAEPVFVFDWAPG